MEKFKNQIIKPDNKFELISEITIPKNKNGENYHYSFATKFCKYLSIELGKDQYYIYDNIIISNIENYIEFYELEREYKKRDLVFDKNKIIKKSDEDKKQYIAERYRKLYECLEKIREEANKPEKDNDKFDEVSRNELDHIIWYSNK